MPVLLDIWEGILMGLEIGMSRVQQLAQLTSGLQLAYTKHYSELSCSDNQTRAGMSFIIKPCARRLQPAACACQRCTGCNPRWPP